LRPAENFHDLQGDSQSHPSPGGWRGNAGGGVSLKVMGETSKWSFHRKNDPILGRFHSISQEYDQNDDSDGLLE
jgi:hypothetical protein